MQFSVGAVVAALVAVANAKAAITNTAFDVVAGQPFTLSWSNATGAVSVILENGPQDNLQPVGSPLASGVTGSSFTWTPPATLPSDTYAFEVIDSTGVPNWSLQFTFVGSASASASLTSASSTVVSSTATSITSVTSTSTSASVSTTASTNSTVTTTTASKTASATTSASKTATTTVPANSNDGQRFSSPLALVLVAVAALVCFN